MKHPRITLGAAALTLAAVGAVLSPPPAHADTFPTARTADRCVEYAGGIRSCVQVDFARQADGTGVRLEGIDGTTTELCHHLEAGGQYDPVRPFWVDPSDERLDYQYEFGEESCTFYKDVSNAGSDTGPMDLRYVAQARVNAGRDVKIYIGWTLYPNGDSRLNYKYTVQV